MIRLGSIGIGDSESRKVLLGFIQKGGEGSIKSGWGGEGLDLGIMTYEGGEVWVRDRLDGQVETKHSEGMGAGSAHSEGVGIRLELESEVR